MANARQRMILGAGLVLIVGMGICPPWKEFGPREQPLPFGTIFAPPTLKDASPTATRVDIDFSRLGLELGLAMFATLALLGLTRTQNSGQPGFMDKLRADLARAQAQAQTQAQAMQAQAAAQGAAQGAAQAAAQNIKDPNLNHIDLPNNYYLGELYQESKEDPEYWEEYQACKGPMDLPKGKKLQLELAKDMRVDFQFFNCFPSDSLYSIDASECRLTDEDIAKLTRLSGLCELDLSATAIGSKAVASLKSMPKLQKIWLDKTNIDDAAIPVLIGMPSLKQVSLVGTQLNELTLESLKKDRPDLVVEV